MNKELLKNIFKPAVLLAAFAFFGVLLLAIVNQETQGQIAENERAALLKNLTDVVDLGTYNNDLLKDKRTLPASNFNSSTPVTVYRARHDTSPIAAVFVTTTLRGYNGSIKLVVGVRKDLSLSGVRIVTHQETPGLGDKMEVDKSNWVLAFNNTSLSAPDLPHWKVKKDGGSFDQFTGATITPRAVVQAVRDVLIWCSEGDNFIELFKESVNDHTNRNEL